jgi:hypothetical protein
MGSGDGCFAVRHASCLEVEDRYSIPLDKKTVGGSSDHSSVGKGRCERSFSERPMPEQRGETRVRQDSANLFGYFLPLRRIGQASRLLQPAGSTLAPIRDSNVGEPFQQLMNQCPTPGGQTRLRRRRRSRLAVLCEL